MQLYLCVCMCVTQFPGISSDRCVGVCELRSTNNAKDWPVVHSLPYRYILYVYIVNGCNMLHHAC